MILLVVVAVEFQIMIYGDDFKILQTRATNATNAEQPGQSSLPSWLCYSPTLLGTSRAWWPPHSPGVGSQGNPGNPWLLNMFGRCTEKWELPFRNKTWLIVNGGFDMF